jgi:hypothetical protein
VTGLSEIARYPYAKPFDAIFSERFNNKNVASAHGAEHILALCLYENWSDGIPLLWSKRA